MDWPTNFRQETQRIIISQMNSNMIDSTQELVHQGSVIVLGVVLLILIIGIIKPLAFKKMFQEFSERKYIVAGSVFISLLSGTIFFATQPANQTFVSDNTKPDQTTITPLKQSQNTDQEPIKTEDIQVIELIAYAKQQQDDPLLPVNQTRIVQPGKDGEKQLIYKVTYHDSQETERVLKEERVLTEPIAEITAIGRQPLLTNDPKPSSSNKKNRPLIRLSCDSKNRPHVCLLRD